ncbi:MAG: alpha-glucosidase/alpha-galactosidase, partial [Clostridia bacterium]|nr:alpha-glucosidase/alpha-galactosidase [Clostridia bacterium]
MSCKICIIGAGSAIFSLNLVKDICVNSRFNGSTVTLMDINTDRLDAIYGLCTRYAEEMNLDIDIFKTTDRREAMQDADFVLNVALDYGHERFKQGIKVAYDNGYRFGGSLHILHDEAFFINFHQLRLMESILVDMLDICPNAYYIMVANPVQGGVTYLSRKYKNAKIIGMCHGYTGVYRIAQAMGLDRNKIGFEISGVNHFIWLTGFRYDAKDGYALLDKWLAEHGDRLVEDREEQKKFGLAVDEIGVKAIDMYKRYGLFPIGDTPSAGGGAWGWEYHTDDAVEDKFESKPY